MNSRQMKSLLLSASVFVATALVAEGQLPLLDPGRLPVSLKGRDPLGGLRMELFGNGPAIDQIAQRHQGRVLRVSTVTTGVFGQRSSSISSPVTMMRCP